MGARRLAARWFLRVGIATAILTGIGMLADRDDASAARWLSKQGMASAPGGIQLSQQPCSSQFCAPAGSMGVGARLQAGRR